MPDRELKKQGLGGALSARHLRKCGMLYALMTLFLNWPLVSGSEAESRFSIQTWQTENGLPENSVTAIEQTPDGYLWLGTQSGLVRFDGLQFTTFNPGNSPGLGSERIWALKTDHTGALWLGTGIGVSRLASGRFTNWSRKNGLANHDVISICIDREGGVWAAGQNGLDRIFNGTITTIPTGYLPEGIREIASDREGRVWVLCRGEGLYFVKNGALERKDFPGLEKPQFRGFLQDSQGNYWAGILYKGLARWNTNGITIWEKGNDIPEADAVTGGIAEDSAGGFWFSLPPMALAHYSAGKFEFMGAKEGLPSVQVRSVFIDREENVWVGTANNGLMRVRRKWVQNLNEKQGLAFYLARAILEEEPGSFLVANEHDGLYRLREGEFTKLSGGALGSLWTLLKRRDGEVLGGKYPFGVARLPDTLPTPSELNLPNEGHVYAVIEDRSGKLWIASDTGVHTYQNGQVKSVTKEAGITETFLSLVEDADGSVWAGGEMAGVKRFEGKNIRSYGPESGLQSQTVRCMQMDDDGNLWVGTARGLSLFRTNRFFTVGSPEGLEDEGINQVLDDGLGNIWIGCNKGIYRLRKGDLLGCLFGTNRTVHPLKIGKAEGLISLECRKGSQPNCLRGADGKLYFLTLKSIAVIDPKQVPATAMAPPVVVQRVIVDGMPVGTVEETKKTAPVEVPAGTMRVEFHFAGLSLSAPESIRYRYRLQGYDNDWVLGGTRRFASYTRVAPGRYSFRVQAANSDGVWSEQETAVWILVLPQFWQTAWFRLLCVSAVLALGYGVYQQRISALDQRRKAQEAFSRQLIHSQEQERRRIAGELHDSLSQELQLIRNRSQMALNFMGATGEVAEQLSEISQASSKAIAEARAISYALRPPELEHLGVTRAIESLLEKVANASGIETTGEIESIEGVLKPELEINLYRIVQEALNNVVKHARAKRVIVGLTRNDQEIGLSIYDDGIGFETNGGTNGSGNARGSLGLSGMSERARILGGTLEVQSALGKGTRLTIVLPIHQETNAS